MTRARFVIVIVIVIGLFQAHGRARADVIHLSSGDTIRGRIVRETPTELIVEVPGGRLSISRADIDKIERESETALLRGEAEDLRRIGALDQAIDLYRRAAASGDREAIERLASAQRAAIARARERGDLIDAERRVPEAGGEAKKLAEEIAAARKKASETAAAGRKQIDKEPGSALAAFREALRIDLALGPALAPLMATAAAAEGTRVAADGDYARGAALFEEAIAHDPGIRPRIASALTNCRIASALQRVRAGDLPSARHILAQAAEEDPGSRAPRFYLGVVSEVAGDPIEASVQYRIALTGTAAPVAAEDIARLRQAALAACGPLPIDPNAFLDYMRFKGAAGQLPVAAARGTIEVRSADGPLAQDVLAAAERAATQIAAWAGAGVRATPVSIVVLENRPRFTEVTQQPEAVLGITLGRPSGEAGTTRTIFTYATAPALLESVIPHEMTHALAMSAVPGRVPLWLNEGLAISSEPDSMGAARLAAYRRERSSGRALAVTELLELDAYPKADRIAAYYDGALALTRFLIAEGGRDKAFAVARAAPVVGLEAALRDQYGFPDLARAANAFEAWLEKNQ